MKTGKTLKLVNYEKAKISYGTVDFKNFKSVYLNIQSWATPKIDMESWVRIVGNLSRELKHIIYENLEPNIFYENFIVDLDLRSSGIIYGKKSFLNLEMTFYVNSKVEFKSVELRNTFISLSNIIYRNIIEQNKYFDFSLSKRSNNKKLNDKTYIYD